MISRAGLRDREFTPPKPPGVFRVAVVGDSVTYGLFSPRNQTYPKQLEAMLNRYASPGAPRFEVLNFGVMGYNVDQIVEVVGARAMAYNPDLLIYGYVLNDPQTFSVEAESLRSMERSARRSVGDVASSGFGVMLHYSRLAQLTYQGWFTVVQEPDLYDDDPAYAALKTGSAKQYIRSLHTQDSAWSRVRSAFGELGDLSRRKHSITTLVALFPISPFQESPQYPLADVHQRITAEARRQGLHTMDLAHTMCTVEAKLRRRLYRDFLHPNPFGQHVAAVAILQELCAAGLLPKNSIDFADLRCGEGNDALIAAAMSDGGIQ